MIKVKLALGQLNNVYQKATRLISIGIEKKKNSKWLTD